MNKSSNSTKELSTLELSELFWQSSSDFYINQAKTHLLDLQNTQNKNINELLFVLWATDYFQIVFEQTLCDSLLSDTQEVKQWINNIRKTRFELESSTLEKKSKTTARQSILQTELELEKIHQQKLIECFYQSFKESKCQILVDIKDITLNNLVALTGKVQPESSYIELIKMWQSYNKS